MSVYATGDQASAWVARFASLIPRGEVLDLACGSGRHARLLAAIGHQVLAVDRDADALAVAAAPAVATMQFDLENAPEGGTCGGCPAWPFAAGRFAGIVVTNYLHRPLFPLLLAGLAPNGVLIYETFAQGNERYGKPSNPVFLLAPGELLDLARPILRVVAFEDVYVDLPKPARVQRLCAIKPAGQLDGA